MAERNGDTASGGMAGKGRPIGEVICEATEEELKAFDPGTLTPEELVRAAGREREQSLRRRRFMRFAGAAAVLVLTVAGALLFFGDPTADVEADKSPREEIVTDDGIIMEDGGWGSESSDSWEITDEDELAVAAAAVSELVVPEYVPAGFAFESLTVREDGNLLSAEYVYVGGDSSMTIQQHIHGEGASATVMVEGAREVDSEIGSIYIFEEHEMKNAIIQTDDGVVIYVWAPLDDDEIIRIAEGLKL